MASPPIASGGGQEDRKDHRCQDVSHRGSLSRNVWDEESGEGLSCVTGGGETTLFLAMKGR